MKRIYVLLLIGFSPLLPQGCKQTSHDSSCSDNVSHHDSLTIKNPVIPGYYANPCIVEYEGKYYMYTTLDPWGGYELAVWESEDLYEWTSRGINWPSKSACTSPASSEYLVGHASVVRMPDDSFYMYVTVGSEIWAGTSDHPLGPWYNMLQPELPLVAANPSEGIRNTGAECFIDPGKGVFLYWTEYGKGGKNKCRVGRLNADMCSFAGEPAGTKIENYYGTPYVLKHRDRYVLFYSQGNYTDPEYRVSYAYGEHPSGPWITNDSRLLQADPSEYIIGPGHFSVLATKDRYLLFYQLNKPSEDHTLLRRICMNELIFDSADNIVPIKVTEEVSLPGLRMQGEELCCRIEAFSSILSEDYPAGNAVDGNFGSMWIPAGNDQEPSLILDLGERQKIRTVYLWMEYSILIYPYIIEYSPDGDHWKIYSDKRDNQENGAPRFDVRSARARYLRISFPRGELPFYRPAIWEIRVE